MSSSPPAAPVAPSQEATRRHLSSRQVATLQRLADAALEELRDAAYDGLTVRSVARRAEVAPATAYTYFTSKEHLVTEVFWRRLVALPETSFAAADGPGARATATLADLASLVVDEPQLAAACSVAMLAADADVKLLRDRIGAEIRRRLLAALGPDVDRTVLRTLELIVSGSLVQAGMGHLRYVELPALLGEVVQLVVGDPDQTNRKRTR
jgi:AcrR family transcriptional regulator